MNLHLFRIIESKFKKLTQDELRKVSLRSQPKMNLDLNEGEQTKIRVV